jgi:cell division septum initiation protein DivIVA
MDENEAVAEQQLATPIFNVYRRGYDPEQVDRYVADQQRRLDDALRRASESERRLAAAVGQLRELHRRVAIYESETRTAQPPALDTLGERVQRILQEAWEGAYSLRQDAEREVNELREAVTQEVAELREVASREAADVVDQATRRALAIRDETERRRHAYLQRIEQDRERAVSQITYLYDQRQDAIAELARLQTTVQAVVEEMARSPLGRPAPGVAVAAASPAASDGSPTLPPEDDTRVRPDRALSRSGGPSPTRLLDQADDSSYRGGERAGRHSGSLAADTSPGYERDDMTAVRARIQDNATAEPFPSPPSRLESVFDEGLPAEEMPETVPSRRRRTGLFDAEQEGWT